MKHHLLYFFTYLLIIASSCNSMENIHQEKILKEITIIKKPNYAQYLTEDRAIITSDNGCSIINPITNEEIKKITNDEGSIVIHPNKQKFALSHKGTITIYDSKEYNKKYQTSVDGYIESFAFCPMDTIIFINLKPKQKFICFDVIVKYNYQTDQQNFIYHRPRSNLALHPTQKIVSFLKDNRTLYSYQSDDFNKLIGEIQLYKSPDERYDPAYTCKYNFDGSSIVAFNHKNIYLIDPHTKDPVHPSFTSNRDEYFLDIAFHPTIPSIFAVLTQSWNFYYDPNNSYLQYYDAKTKKYICTTPFSLPERCYDLSLCPSGKKALITLKNSAFVMPIPFEVLKTKVVAFIYWILKNYQFDHPEVPNDVIYYIMKHL